MKNISSHIAGLQPFFHNFILDGIRTKPITGNSWDDNYPQNLWEIIYPFIEDAKDKNVLDIGCNAGFFSYKFADMGANVLGVDCEQPEATKFSFKNAIEQAIFIRDFLGYNAEFRREDFFNIEEMFDVILFLGVYYHLKDHTKALRHISSILNNGGILYFESAIGEKCEFFREDNIYHEDRSNYFVPTVDYILEDLKRNGFKEDGMKFYRNDRLFIKARKV